ncbi:hypothetical protein GOP47_0016654 [Adiantum capillus-veneris]|uniref:Senescence domain-containing protein n=1 Tax=Adiantum capillus-veneris TaxID=13818 RepID=A0A9D4UIW1_ADICA|nr:hypothetical protein GOP47_0016654 [Adiantum capillus-veneris]
MLSAISAKQGGSSHGGKKKKEEDAVALEPTETEEVEVGNSVIVSQAQGSSQGSEETLLKIPGAIVHLVDGDESAHLATGIFSLVRLASQDGNGIAVFAKVGDDLQWPLAKDVPTAKLDENHYFFTLHVPPEAEDGEVDDRTHGHDGPDMLNYGVTFANDGGNSLLAELDKYLEQYSFFSLPQIVQGAPERKAELEKEVKEKGKGHLDRLEEFLFGKTNPPAKPVTIPEDAKLNAVPASISSPAEKKKYVEEKSSAYWTTLAPNVEEYSSSMAKGIASQSNTVIKGLFWCSDATIQQLERLGDYAKARIKTKEKPSQISPRTMRNLRRAGKKFFRMLPGEVALVSLDVFVKVFDAVEVAGKSVLTSTRVVACGVVSHRYGEQAAEAAHEGLSTAGHVFSTAWTISKIRKALNPNRASSSKLSKKALMKAALKGKEPVPAL